MEGVNNSAYRLTASEGQTGIPVCTVIGSKRLLAAEGEQLNVKTTG
jgi:hypothetical protein